MTSSTGRSIPDPGFAGDSGGGDPALAAALAAYAADPGRAPEALHALSQARLLVPVVAVLVEEDEPVGGLRREKSTDMALVTVARPDGARALPAFTSLASLAAWRPDARPVPVEAARAALSAAAEGAVALLVDPAGPVRFVVTGSALRAVAEGAVEPPLYSDPEALAAARAAVADEPAVTAVRLDPAPGADARLTLTVGPGATLEPLLQRVGERLRADPLLRRRALAGLDVAVEPG